MPIKKLPKDEGHLFVKGSMTAVVYPISDETLVWTVTASTARMQEVGLELNFHPSWSQNSKDKDFNGSAASHNQQAGQQLSASEVRARLNLKLLPLNASQQHLVAHQERPTQVSWLCLAAQSWYTALAQVTLQDFDHCMLEFD